MIPYVPLVPTQSFIDLLANAFTYFYLPKSVTPHKSFLICPSLFVCTTYFVVFASPLLGCLPFTVFCLVPPFYANFPDFYAKLYPYLFPRVVPCTLWMNGGREGGKGRVGSHGCHGVFLGLVHAVTRACGLTCQPDSRFQTPVRLPVLQGTGELSSADNM